MHLRMGQVPEFIGVNNLVSLVHSLLDCSSAPCALQGSYVPATISHHGIVKLIVNIGGLQWKGEFVPHRYRATGWYRSRGIRTWPCATPKYWSRSVRSTSLWNSGWPTGSSVNPRVQVREVINLHFLFTLRLVTQCEHIFPSPVELIQLQNSRVEAERSY